MFRLCKNILFFLMLFAVVIPAYSQKIDSMEFRNQSISDILLVLGELSGTSIVPDETVEGNASYYFNDVDIETALSLFLSSYNYYFTKVDDVYYVSRINISSNPENSRLSINAENTDIQLIIRAISRKIGKTILYDALPRENLTIHADLLPIDSILEIIIKKYSDYYLESEEGFYYIRKEALQGSNSRSGARSDLFVERDGLYNASFEQIRYKEALSSLFTLTGKEYSFLGRNDSIIEKFEFSEKSFEQIFRLLLEQGNGDYKVIDDIYYIIDIERRDILKKFYTTVYLPLHKSAASDVVSLIPSSIGSSSNIKVDKNNNALILSGTLEEVSPIQDFVAMLDQQNREMVYHRFPLSSLDASSITGLLPTEYQFSTPVILQESNSFIMLLPPTKIDEVSRYIELIDMNSNGYPVQLKYIKGEQLLENPPPSADKEDLAATNDPNIIYFKGTERRYGAFLKDLELLDRPVPQIRYEVLVMQVQEANKFDWDINSSNSIASDDSQTSIVGEIGSLLNLNFDVVSQFGYQFAMDLNISMENSESKIMADTSLNALSGENTNFQNTETYRYQEIEIDPDTGAPETSGVTREITSGLIVEIEGWTSGDGMITMEVTTTISKRDDTSSSSSTSIPTTTERSVTTHIRTESGKPVIIGGLMQQDIVKGIKKTPILGDIPILGYLFRTETESVQNTEMVITIVPYLEYPEYSLTDVEREIESLYNRFIRP